MQQQIERPLEQVETDAVRRSGSGRACPPLATRLTLLATRMPPIRRCPRRIRAIRMRAHPSFTRSRLHASPLSSFIASRTSRHRLARAHGAGAARCRACERPRRRSPGVCSSSARRSRIGASSAMTCLIMIFLHSRQPMPAVRQPVGDVLDLVGRAVDAVQVEGRAVVGLAGVGAAHAARVGHHAARAWRRSPRGVSVRKTALL